jgi:hypothetical protein
MSLLKPSPVLERECGLGFVLYLVYFLDFLYLLLFGGFPS